MKKEDCRVGLVVYHPVFGAKGVVLKCNPKKARVNIVEGSKNRRSMAPGSIWNMPYGGLYPVVDAKTEMAMRSFEQPESPGIKAYFANARRADEPVDFPDGSPEHHLVKAVCELWRRLEDEEGLRARHSEMINRIFNALGREVSKEAAMEWEAGKIEGEKV
jgi:hypothetical protein